MFILSGRLLKFVISFVNCDSLMSYYPDGQNFQ